MKYFKFGGQVDQSLAYDDKLPLKGAWSALLTHFWILEFQLHLWNGRS